MFIKKLFSIAAALLLVAFVFPTPAHASSKNFVTDYAVTYTIGEDGVTHAVVNVIMTNTTTQYYATSYRMQLGLDDITNLKATDPDGPLSPVLRQDKDGYYIDLKFNTKSVGLNKKMPFSVAFDTSSIARGYGKIWEINIPGIANPDEFPTFNVAIKTPASFGKPTYIKPHEQKNSLSFTKEELGKSGVSIAFGERQFYAFHLTYHVKNPNLYAIKKTIAIPASTNYQDVYIRAMNPAPENVYVDRDGNWIAEYPMQSAQKMDVVVNGKAEVRLYPNEQIAPQADLLSYLTEKPYWEVKDPQIEKLAKKLKTPEAIYNYVVSTLKYDFSRVTDGKERLGAVKALQNKNSAVCREFTDLFIAISRAAGIPAREVNGFAYTDNSRQKPVALVKNILHAWPEYYDTDKKTWIMVDPTWGSATGGIDYFSLFDLDHLSFVIKGTDSSSPVPAGDYTLEGETSTKDVVVGFTDDNFDNESEAEVTAEMPDSVMAGLPLQGSVTIRNIGGVLIPEQILYVSSPSYPTSAQTIAVPSIPPFGYAVVNIILKPASILTNTEATFTIRVAGQTKSQKVKIRPFVLNPIGGGITLGILTLIILIIAIKSGRLHLFK